LHRSIGHGLQRFRLQEFDGFLDARAGPHVRLREASAPSSDMSDGGPMTSTHRPPNHWWRWALPMCSLRNSIAPLNVQKSRMGVQLSIAVTQ
jgi:hypothetical protein